MRAGRAAELAALLVLMAAVALGVLSAGPPSVTPVDAPLSRFSAARALAEVGTIARAPHPVGSEEHDRVRDALAARLADLGFSDLHTQTTTGFTTRGGTPRAATVANIVARRRGTHSTGALLLTAHYDAVPRSFGAADDGSGVAAILESLHTLATGPPLANDLIVLFSDAEEEGLLGSEAFVDLDSLSRDVRAVLNFDARGTSGPSYMFETSVGNGALIDLLAANVPDARANSLTGEVYRHLTSDTDLSIWLHLHPDVAALNFAFIGGYAGYHTPLDNISSLDPRSLQHQGDYVLGLTRALGNADLTHLTEPEQVYFDAPLLGLVHYPAAMAAPFAWLLVLATALILAIAARRGMLSGRGLAAGGAVQLLGLVLPAWLALGGWRAIRMIHPAYADMLQGEPYPAAFYLLAFSLFTLALVVVLQFAARRWASVMDLVAVPLVVWSVAGVFIARELPGASYVLAWPLAAALAGAAVGIWRMGWHVALLAIPALVILPPLAMSLEIALTVNFLVGSTVVLALGLTLIAPALAQVGSIWRVATPLCVVAGVASLAWAEAHAGFNAARKHPDSLTYLLDGDSGKAWWISFDRAPDGWNQQVLGAAPHRLYLAQYRLGAGADSLLAVPTDVATVPAPAAQVLSSAATSDGRRIHLRVGRMGGAQELLLVAEDSSVRVTDVVLNGRVLSDSTGDRYAPDYHTSANGTVLTWFGVPPQGIDMWLTVHAATLVPFRIAVTSEGFPDVPNAPSPRLPAFMSKPFVPTDVTIVERTITL
ncbi:MAG TPA: M28 family peptidase [Gemmatimonadales bacterium]|nr:M28 family peptidase [Gemmatimonadales bacterium]